MNSKEMANHLWKGIFEILNPDGEPPTQNSISKSIDISLFVATEFEKNVDAIRTPYWKSVISHIKKMYER
jgi:hypothetical protein